MKGRDLFKTQGGNWSTISQEKNPSIKKGCVPIAGRVKERISGSMTKIHQEQQA